MDRKQDQRLTDQMREARVWTRPQLERMNEGMQDVALGSGPGIDAPLLQTNIS